MALTADLLATPLSSAHSPSGTLSGLASKLTSEIPLTETDTEDQFEAPSPCVERAARRIQRKVPRSTSRQNFTIQEYLRVHNSPQRLVLSRAAAILLDPVDGGRGTEEQISTVEDTESHADDDEKIEADDRETTQDCPNVLPETTDTGSLASAIEEPRITETPSFTPKKYTIHEIVQRMRDAMESNYSDGPGHAYLLYDRSGKSPFLKIGKSVRVRVRKGQHQRECQLEEWDTKQRPVTSIPRPMRLERIAQAELRNLACDPSCICGVKHQEYFWVSKETGFELLEFWARWLKVHDPYDEEESLKGFWVDRLDEFQENAREYFRCDSEQCADQDEDAPACQACLRAGWKKWAEPTASDELEYACREKFSSTFIRQSFQKLGGFNFFPKSWLMPLVLFVAYVVSFCLWISDRKVFFHLIALRLAACHMKPRFPLPGESGSWGLGAVDITLCMICYYHRFQRVEGEPKPRDTPKGKVCARRTSPRKTSQISDGYRDSFQTPGSCDSTRSLAGTKRRRKSA